MSKLRTDEKKSSIAQVETEVKHKIFSKTCSLFFLFYYYEELVNAQTFLFEVKKGFYGPLKTHTKGKTLKHKTKFT